jgi:CubicO group peptidase (beta-lactamase class C family)
MASASGGMEVMAIGGKTYDGESLNEDAIFDVASITKTIPTSCLALQCVERGMIRLEDRILNLVPELSMPGRATITIRHLLTHTIDQDFALSDYKNLPPEEILNVIFRTPLATPAGTKFHYTNATSILLGLCVERASHAKLDVLAADRFFIPLGMRDTTFAPDANSTRIVPTEDDPWRGRLIRGEVHDESAWILRRIMTPGSAGLFSTVRDILKFATMILNDGSANGHRFFTPETIELMATNQLASIGGSTGLGWELNQEWFMGTDGNRRIGKTGFTGCSIVIDLDMKKALVILSNRVFPHRPPDSSAINLFRREIANDLL